MSHDFAKSRRPAPPSSKKKKGTAGVPSWVWMLSGTLAGALVMYLVYVSGYAPPLPDLKKAQQVAATPANQSAAVPDKEPPAPPKRTSPVFEFYTKLPGSGAPSVDSTALPGAQTAPPVPPPAATELDPIQQLLAQQEAARQQAAGNALPANGETHASTAVPDGTTASTVPAATTTAPTTTAPTTASTTPTGSVPAAAPAATALPEARTAAAKPVEPAVKSGGRYALQAGAFRKRSEADTLRAKLLMLGVQASIQPVTNAKGESLHRVIAGPFASAAEMEDAKIILSGNHINTIPVK